MNDDTITHYVEKIQPEIAYCATCQPYDGGEVVWILGIQKELEELLDEYDVPEELRDELVNQLICQGCHRELCRYDDIGLKNDEEIAIDEKWEEWYIEYEHQVDEFAEFLEENPYLGLAHDIGKSIFDNLPKFPKCDIEKEIWWRARMPEGGKKFRSGDMYPLKHPESEGRYNHYGQQVFYMASTAEAAFLEKRQKDDCLCWVQKFEIQGIDNIVDLSGLYHIDEMMLPTIALGLINIKLSTFVPDENSPWKPQYFIPRFIADCTKYYGFNGIKFSSRRHYDNNLVLFRWEEQNIKSFNEPKILEYRKMKADEDMLF